MKKLIERILLITIMLSFFTMAFANSGPVFWQGYPSSDVMSIEANSPITVINEDLVFDFSSYNDSDVSMSGKVTAAYEMLNPTKESQSVTMAFPYVEALDSLLLENIVITADNRVLPYDIYFGDVVESRGNPRYDEKETSYDFANIVSNITKEPYIAENFKENEKGKLYTIKVNPATDQGINFEILFSIDRTNTRVFTNGFNSYQQTNGNTTISATCYAPKTLEIFVLGEDLELYVNAYLSGAHRQKTDLLTYEISSQVTALKPYLMDYIKSNTNIRNSSISFDDQLYNLYAQALDRTFKINMGYCTEYDLMALEQYKRILTLVYNVEFPPNSKKEITVSYKTSGTMDKTKTPKPLYTFDYILNPAENWDDFKNLNITVIPPRQAPYIVKSSVAFTEAENNIYTATLAALPNEDLSFTLYADKKVTLLDKSTGSLQKIFGYLTPFLISAIMLVIVIIIVVVRLKTKKKGD